MGTAPRTTTPQNGSGIATGAAANRIRAQAGRTTAARTATTRPPAQHRQMTPAETIARVERIDANTPNEEIERIVTAISRHQRERAAIPATFSGYKGNWEWVLFEVTRGLRRTIRHQQEQMRSIANLQVDMSKAVRDIISAKPVNENQTTHRHRTRTRSRAARRERPSAQLRAA